jgi:hypothetical protein
VIEVEKEDKSTIETIGKFEKVRNARVKAKRFPKGEGGKGCERE